MKCDQCGVCCNLFLINLNEEEYKSGNYKTEFESFGIINDFVEAEFSGSNIIEQKKDGSCFYLEDGNCSIHKTRPKACREFFCSSENPKFETMIKKINEKKK